MADVGSGERRRPFLVYVIVGYILVSAAWTIAGVWLLFSDGEGGAADGAIRAELDALRAAIGPVDIAFMAVILALNLLAAISLFRLKRRAVALFAAVVAATLLSQLWMFVFRFELVAAQGPVVGIVGVLLPLLFLLYASRLQRRGLLA